MKLDTGALHPDTMSTVHGLEEGQRIVVTNHKRARTIFNKIKANIEAQELIDVLDAYWERESLMLDALHLFDPHIVSELRETYEMHRSCLVHGGVARRTPSGTQPPQAPESQTGKTGGEDETGYW